MKKIDIVIVNWNAGLYLLECVESVVKYSNDLVDKIVIVDNSSTDNSVSLIGDISGITLIENSGNFGFAKACNIGAKICNSEHILFLNPDTQLYEKSLTTLFKCIEQEDDFNVGIYGIQLQDSNGVVQRTCARFPTAWSFVVRSLGLNKINKKIFQSYAMHEWDHKNSRVVDEVMGAFFMVKTDLFRKLMGFDERYFVYYEELDFSKRAFEAGYKTKYIVESQAFHKGGGVSGQVKAQRLFYNLQSRMLYSFKHFGKSKGFFIVFITLLVEPFARLFFGILKRNKSEVLELISGYKMLIKNSFIIIKQGLKK